MKIFQYIFLLTSLVSFGNFFGEWFHEQITRGSKNGEEGSVVNT